MKVNYLNHSGVSVESGDDLFIFDYYKKGVDPSDFKTYGNIYVFVSHGHGDHFDKEILSWAKKGISINYVFSSDIKPTPGMGDILFMKPGEKRDLKDISIFTLESTDEGVAFLVQTTNGNIFHSGDLNWWHWSGEPEWYNRDMEIKFKKQIDLLKEYRIGVAFIPVDKRLDNAMYYSIDYLMKNVDIKMVCPIHFWDDWESLGKMRKDLADREYYNKINFYGEKNEIYFQPQQH